MVSGALRASLGRRNYARLARYLWMDARLDVDNDPQTNGERLVQKAFVATISGEAPSCVFDVGANVGTWSRALIEMLSLNQALELHLFEPAPGARKRLGSAFAATRGPSVAILPLALSEEEGEATFNIFDDAAGTNTLVAAEGDAPRETITIQRTTVDAYCRAHAISRIHFLKIDTEGNDLLVLRGARNMLEAGRIDLIQFEYNQRWIAFRAYLKDVFDLVLPLGYSIGKITPLGVEVYPRWHFELESFREGNYLVWRGGHPRGLKALDWWNAAVWR